MGYTRLGQTDLKGGLRKPGDQLVRDASPAWLRRNLDTVSELERFAEQREFPVVQLAIAWTLAHPAVDVAIVGARNARQIEQTAPGPDIHLGSADLAEIERITTSAVRVGGPASELM